MEYFIKYSTFLLKTIQDMKNIVLFLVLIIILAFVMPSLLNAAFTIGVLVIMTVFGYFIYKIVKFMDNTNKKKEMKQ